MQKRVGARFLWWWHPKHTSGWTKMPRKVLVEGYLIFKRPSSPNGWSEYVYIPCINVYFPFFQFLNLCPKETENVNIERKWVVPFVYWDSQPPFQGKYKSILKKLWYLQTFPIWYLFNNFGTPLRFPIFQYFPADPNRGKNKSGSAVIANESSWCYYHVCTRLSK